MILFEPRPSIALGWSNTFLLARAEGRSNYRRSLFSPGKRSLLVSNSFQALAHGFHRPERAG